jgi:hypothetical protein
MARSMADLVLVHGSFAVLTPMVEQGRQALRNVQRVGVLGAAGVLDGGHATTTVVHPARPSTTATALDAGAS